MPPEPVNTYAAPVCLFLSGALTTAVVPDRATAVPKKSPEAAPAAVSSARWVQVAPEPVNTYAAPVFVFLSGAPTTAVDPDRATASPNRSKRAPSAAVSSARWVQVPPEPVNTYAA